jgi:hypothetical protein
MTNKESVERDRVLLDGVAWQRRVPDGYNVTLQGDLSSPFLSFTHISQRRFEGIEKLVASFRYRVELERFDIP